jgi:hypothetical protein
MSSHDYEVQSLVRMVNDGTLRLPEMQREYVWTATKVRDLFDSLYRGYPSGVILAWEPSVYEAEGVSTRGFAVGTKEDHHQTYLLLDGQQRLTSLSAVLRGEPVRVKNRVRPIQILFNLEHPDALMSVMEVDSEDSEDEAELDVQEKLRRRAFVVGSKSLAGQQNWVLLTDIFTKDAIDILEEKGFDFATLDPAVRRKYTKRLGAVKAIERYNYRVEILESDKSYNEVTEIFVRVNSLGARLRSSDLALAQITATWRGSLETFTTYERHTAERGFALDLDIILRTLVALITNQSRFAAAASLRQADLEAGWQRTVKALDFAHNYLVNDLGIESRVVLTSPFLVAATAYWGDMRDYRIDSEDKAAFGRWLLIANAKGRYSRGSAETTLDQDLAELRGSGVPGLLQRLTNQVGRLDFTDAELEGKTPRSGAFKTLLLALRKAQAVDWDTNLLVSAKHDGASDVVEYHHIFPQAYLKQVRMDLGSSQVNDIANMAIIGGSTNRRISKTAPSIYRDWFTREVLAKHLVDFDDCRDQPENYEEFLARRRSAIRTTLNDFLGVGGE